MENQYPHQDWRSLSGDHSQIGDEQIPPQGSNNNRNDSFTVRGSINDDHSSGSSNNNKNIPRGAPSVKSTTPYTTTSKETDSLVGRQKKTPNPAKEEGCSCLIL